MQRLLYTLALIVAGLAGGYVLQRVIRERSARHEELLSRLRKGLQRFSILGLMPASFLGAFWIIPFDDLRIALLPVIGSGTILLGGVLGFGVARAMKKRGGQKSALLCCASFSNLGSLGGLTSFLFLGERGFALLALYKVFEELIYYGIGFPVARYYRRQDETAGRGGRFLEVFRDPFFLVAVGAFLTGLSLNVSGVPRPPVYERLIGLFVPVGVFLILVSIGLGMRFSKVRRYLAEGAAVAAIKFVILPLAAGTAAWLLGLHRIQDGLPMKIVLIGSSMPVAFLAVVVASVYDLDLELANSCWLITTCSMVLVLPWLYFLFSLF